MRSSARSGLLSLLALAACRPPAPPPPATPATPSGTISRDAALENTLITVHLDVPPTPAGPKPAVITLLGERDALIDAGMVVVTYQIHWERLKGLAPPAPPPGGQTVGVWLLASPSARTVGQGYFNIIATNAGNAIPKVLDYLATVSDVDPARIGVAGASTNGFIALEAAADSRVAAAAVIAACGDYHRFLHRSNLALNGQPLDLDPAYERSLRAQEPIRHPRRFTHAAILMVNGAEDQSIPPACARETARVLRASYRRARVPERFRFVMVEGAGHNLPDQARYETLAWLRRWLWRSF